MEEKAGTIWSKCLHNIQREMPPPIPVCQKSGIPSVDDWLISEDCNHSVQKAFWWMFLHGLMYPPKVQTNMQMSLAVSHDPGRKGCSNSSCVSILDPLPILFLLPCYLDGSVLVHLLLAGLHGDSHFHFALPQGHVHHLYPSIGGEVKTLHWQRKSVCCSYPAHKSCPSALWPQCASTMIMDATKDQLPIMMPCYSAAPCHHSLPLHRVQTPAPLWIIIIRMIISCSFCLTSSILPHCWQNEL